ncbi:hypothetical protein MTR67_034518 [Solanum verrucosum]|uniref:Uncharacterized protein n=1 Tax=Solanum verrucosum TaxID=315347 RepID=A0AAF0ZKH5_SOLVR|nr:hypothetical protein MTR67_034518 [Solanum verrucosum]
MDFITSLPQSLINHDSIWGDCRHDNQIIQLLYNKGYQYTEEYANLHIREIIDVQAEHTIQTVEDMVIACGFDFKGNWDDHLPLIDFEYNNRYHSNIQMALYETLYGRTCRNPIG